jgi:hypothetical protein
MVLFFIVGYQLFSEETDTYTTAPDIPVMETKQVVPVHVNHSNLRYVTKKEAEKLSYLGTTVLTVVLTLLLGSVGLLLAPGCEQEQEEERIAESSRLFRAAPEHRDRLRLRQNSRRRIPLARKLRQSLLNFCPCPSLPYCRPLFSDHRFTSAQIALLEQVRWSNAYTRSLRGRDWQRRAICRVP